MHMTQSPRLEAAWNLIRPETKTELAAYAQYITGWSAAGFQ
jgi:hypothetical protein